VVLEMVQVPELQRLAPTLRWLHNICFTLPIRQDKTRQFINARRVNRKGNYYNLTIHFPRYVVISLNLASCSLNYQAGFGISKPKSTGSASTD